MDEHQDPVVVGVEQSTATPVAPTNTTSSKSCAHCSDRIFRRTWEGSSSWWQGYENPLPLLQEAGFVYRTNPMHPFSHHERAQYANLWANSPLKILNTLGSSLEGSGGSQRADGALSVPSKSLSYTERYVRSFSVAHELPGHSGCVNSIEFNRDGTRLLTGSDDLTVCIYNTANWKLLRRCHTMHTANIFHAVFSLCSPSAILSCGLDGRTLLTDVETHQTFFKCRFMSTASSIAVSPEWPFTAYVAYGTGSIVRIDTRERESPELMYVATPSLGNNDAVSCVNAIAVHPSQPFVMASVGDSPFVHLHDTRMTSLGTFATLAVPGVRHSGIGGISFSERGDMLAINFKDNDIFVAPWQRSMGITEFHNEPKRRRTEDSAPQLFGAPHCQRYTLKDAVQLRHRTNSTTMFKEVGFAFNDEIVFSGGDCGNLFFWRRRDGALLHKIGTDADVVNGVTTHPSLSQIVTAGIDSTTKVLQSNGDLTHAALSRRGLGQHTTRVGFWRYIRSQLQPELQETPTGRADSDSNSESADATGSSHGDNSDEGSGRDADADRPHLGIPRGFHEHPRQPEQEDVAIRAAVTAGTADAENDDDDGAASGMNSFPSAAWLEDRVLDAQTQRRNQEQQSALLRCARAQFFMANSIQTRAPLPLLRRTYQTICNTRDSTLDRMLAEGFDTLEGPDFSSGDEEVGDDDDDTSNEYSTYSEVDDESDDENEQGTYEPEPEGVLPFMFLFDQPSGPEGETVANEAQQHSASSPTADRADMSLSGDDVQQLITAWYNELSARFAMEVGGGAPSAQEPTRAAQDPTSTSGAPVASLGNESDGGLAELAEQYYQHLNDLVPLPSGSSTNTSEEDENAEMNDDILQLLRRQHRARHALGGGGGVSGDQEGLTGHEAREQVLSELFLAMQHVKNVFDRNIRLWRRPDSNHRIQVLNWERCRWNMLSTLRNEWDDGGREDPAELNTQPPRPQFTGAVDEPSPTRSNENILHVAATDSGTTSSDDEDDDDEDMTGSAPPRSHELFTPRIFGHDTVFESTQMKDRLKALLQIFDVLLEGKMELCGSSANKKKLWMLRCAYIMRRLYFYMAIGDREGAMNCAAYLDSEPEFQRVVALGSVPKNYFTKNQGKRKRRKGGKAVQPAKVKRGRRGPNTTAATRSPEKEHPRTNPITRGASQQSSSATKTATTATVTRQVTKTEPGNPEMVFNMPPLLVPLALQLRIAVLSTAAEERQRQVIDEIHHSESRLGLRSAPVTRVSDAEVERRQDALNVIHELHGRLRKRLVDHPNKRVQKRTFRMLLALAKDHPHLLPPSSQTPFPPVSTSPSSALDS